MNPDFWKNNPRRSLWQRPLWQKLQEAIGRSTFVLQNPGAQALIIRRSMPLGLNWLEVPRGPLFESKKALEDMIAKIKELGQKENSVFIRMSCYDPIIETIPNLRLRNYDHHPQTSLVLGLRLPEEALLEQMKPKGRYNIHVAQKHNVHVEPSTDVPAFHHLLKGTAERDGFKLHPESYYATLLEVLGDHGQMFLAEYEGRKVAGGIFVYLDDWAIYYYGASDHHYRSVMAPYLLQWEAIREAKKRGCQFYDFLGISPEGSKNHRWAGVTEFKMKFGGEVKTYPQAREMVLRPWAYFFYQLYKRIRS